MIAWLGNNIGTILISLALAALVALVIVKMVKDKARPPVAEAAPTARCAAHATRGMHENIKDKRPL